MDFNFRETYQNLSDEELITIVANAEKYQPQAVAVARELLAQRGITEDAIIGYSEKVAATTNQHKKTNRWSGDSSIRSAIELLDPSLRPDTEQQQPRWMRLLFLGVLLYYVWHGYFQVRTLCQFVFQTGMGPYMSYEVILFTAGDLLLVLAGLFLSSRRHRWGWLIMAFLLAFSCSNRVLTLFTGAFGSFRVGITWLSLAALSGLLLYGWCKERVCSLFGVSRRDKTSAIAFAVGVTLFLFVVFRFWWG